MPRVVRRIEVKQEVGAKTQECDHALVDAGHVRPGHPIVEMGFDFIVREPIGERGRHHVSHAAVAIAVAGGKNGPAGGASSTSRRLPPTRRARSAGSPTSSSGPRRVVEHRAWAGVGDTIPNRPAPTTASTCSAASSATATASVRSRRSASTMSLRGPTTPRRLDLAPHQEDRQKMAGVSDDDDLQDHPRQRHPHAQLDIT